MVGTDQHPRSVRLGFALCGCLPELATYAQPRALGNASVGYLHQGVGFLVMRMYMWRVCAHNSLFLSVAICCVTCVVGQALFISILSTTYGTAWEVIHSKCRGDSFKVQGCSRFYVFVTAQLSALATGLRAAEHLFSASDWFAPAVGFVLLK